jgi:hypothetical protein
VGLQDRLQRGLQLLPADGVEVEPAGDRSIGVLGDRQPPALGGVGFGPVGIEAGEVVVHHPA